MTGLQELCVGELRGSATRRCTTTYARITSPPSPLPSPSSYNAVNGVPTCANAFLASVLRATWNFSGYMTSDTGAIESIYNAHHYVKTDAEAACVAIEDGTTDVCSGPTYHDNVLGCSSAAINASLSRTFGMRMNLGLFDPIDDQPYWRIPIESVDTQASRDLNLLATQKSLVLLKNSGVLPLSPGKKVAVVGPHANATTALVGNYLGQICPSNNFECIKSPFQSIADINGQDNTVLAALPSLVKNDSAAWTSALAAAAAADTVVILLGLDGSLEGESSDRTSIDLPALQHAFASAVASLGKETVIVLVHGGAVDTTAERDSAGIGAMVDSFYPGFLGSDAIATTLFGTNDYCGGKMAFTTYPASYVQGLTPTDSHECLQPTPFASPLHSGTSRQST